jgi:hypothetical protein
MPDEDHRPTPAAESQQEEPSSAQEAVSADSSTASSAASFISDPGPDFEPGNEREGFEAPEPGSSLHALPSPEPGWEEDTVRSILTAKGGAIHAVAGVAEEDWLYTEADLAAIAPPLTRILNRYPVTQAAAGTGDELAVVIGLSGYTMRSWAERKAEIEALAEQPEVPVSGLAAEPDTGPPDAQGEWRTGE